MLASIIALALFALPDAPHAVVDKKFVAASAAGITVTLLDSYGTSLIRQHWMDAPLHAPVGPCKAETGEPWLYGRHPGPLAAYSVGAAKIIASESLAYWLKRRHSKFWFLPIAATLPAIQGVVDNFQNCR